MDASSKIHDDSPPLHLTKRTQQTYIQPPNITCIPSVADSLAEACGGLLLALLQPIHGCVRETAAVVLRPLTLGILGVHSNSGKARAAAPERTPAAVRASLLEFVGLALRWAST